MFEFFKHKGQGRGSFPGLDAYERLGTISEGSRSVLYKARERGREEIYCLKLLKQNSAETADKLRRIGMRWEGDWNLSVLHPTIVESYYAGKEKDTYYVLQEYLGGSSLLHCIYFDTERLDNRRLELSRAILESTAFTHGLKIIHRDICPKNFMFNTDGVLKLIDFGIALSAGDTVLKRAGITGTPSYMAPEIYNSREYSYHTDVFAIGVTLFELFTGAKPFKLSAGEAQSAVKRHVHVETPKPRDLNPDISRDLENIILRAMSKEPSARYPSAGEMKAAIDRL